MKMQLVDSKSILAKLMATENLIVEQRNVQTAAFDVENRILTLPMLDKNISSVLYDLFVGHEVGHALYTPQNGMKKAMDEGINMSIANVVEDSRIERKIKDKYPGLRSSFLKAYKELVDRDFFGIKGVDLNELNLIDRINLHCKAGAASAIKFSNDERILLKEVESTQTYDDVIEVCKKLMEEMEKQEEEKEKKAQQEGTPEDREVEEEQEDYEDDFLNFDDELDDEDSEQEQKPKKSQNSKSDSEDDDSDDETDGKIAGDEELEGRGVYDNNERVDDKLKSFTDESFKRNEQKLFMNDGLVYDYVDVPKVDLSRAILDYKILYSLYKRDEHEVDRESFVKFRRDSNKVVSYLVKEFELRKNADQLKRASTAKTGDLNLNKIFSYGFSEDIFKKITVVPGGKSHGLIMFLDWSGSMGNHIFNTVKQLINLSLFCKKVSIPFEVYAFNESGNGSVTTAKENELVVANFRLLNLLSSRMSASEFMYAGSALMALARRPNWGPEWMRMSSTPLNQSIISAMEIIPQFRKKNKLQIVNTVFLTDGEGDILRSYWSRDSHGSLCTTLISRFDGKKHMMVVRDPVSKNQEIVEDIHNCNQVTEAYLKLFKARTGSNVVGFYILTGREFNTQVDHFFPESVNRELVKIKFRKEKSLVITNRGFDEYYLIRSESMNTEKDTEFEVKENASTRSLVTAFSKYTGNRVANRIILNRFIGLIA
jgi:hypothetical protein